MCQALALGADKNWPNPDDRNRHPLHAAVLTVSSIFYSVSFNLLVLHLSNKIQTFYKQIVLLLGFSNTLRLSFIKWRQSERPRSKRQDTITLGNKGRTHNASVFVFKVQSEPTY